jgi:hypothetical protein
MLWFMAGWGNLGINMTIGNYGRLVAVVIGEL